MVVSPENQFVTVRAHPKLVLIKPKIIGRKLILTAPDVSNVEIDFDELIHGEPSKNSIWNVAVSTIECGEEAAIWLSRYILGKECGLRLVYCSDYSSNKPLHKWNNMHKITAKDAVSQIIYLLKSVYKNKPIFEGSFPRQLFVYGN